jgi:hypothetical protein
MAHPQFALAKPDLQHGLDGFVERAVAEAVGLRADNDPVELRFRRCEHPGRGNRRERQFPKIAP